MFWGGGTFSAAFFLVYTHGKRSNRPRTCARRSWLRAVRPRPRSAGGSVRPRRLPVPPPGRRRDANAAVRIVAGVRQGRRATGRRPRRCPFRTAWRKTFWVTAAGVRRRPRRTRSWRRLRASRRNAFRSDRKSRRTHVRAPTETDEEKRCHFREPFRTRVKKRRLAPENVFDVETGNGREYEFGGDGVRLGARVRARVLGDCADRGWPAVGALRPEKGVSAV